MIVLERNRRVAKAYARAPIVTVNGSDEGFDGFRIGVAGFDNPMRDVGTEETIRQINQVRAKPPNVTFPNNHKISILSTKREAIILCI